MPDLNDRAAKLAGWTIRGYGNGEWTWLHPNGRIESSDPPDYENSMDCQNRDLVPLVEAKWGPFNETIYQTVIRAFACGITFVNGDPKGIVGTGPTRASARAAAILAALEATP